LGKRTIGIATIVFFGGGSGVKIFEEGEGGLIDVKVVASFPLRDGGV